MVMCESSGPDPHKEKEDVQIKVIGQITELLMNHEKYITKVRQEVYMLKNKVQNMAHELMKHFNIEVESTEKEQNVEKSH